MTKGEFLNIFNKTCGTVTTCVNMYAANALIPTVSRSEVESWLNFYVQYSRDHNGYYTGVWDTPNNPYSNPFISAINQANGYADGSAKAKSVWFTLSTLYFIATGDFRGQSEQGAFQNYVDAQGYSPVLKANLTVIDTDYVEPDNPVVPVIPGSPESNKKWIYIGLAAAVVIIIIMMKKRK